jgi:hypothetical protein
MEAHEAMERFERAEELSEARERFGRHAAILVAVLAALLAFAALGANRAEEDAILDQARSTDAFNELEANSLKKHINTDDATMLRLLSSGSSTHAIAQAKAAALERAVARKYGPKEKQLLVTARDFENKSHRAERHHRGFQAAEAAFQIGIVLTSVAIVARAVWLVLLGAGLGLAGIMFLIDGFTLFWRLP